MTKFQVDAKKMMQDTLPVYITNCLMVAGFDDAEVIATMGTSQNPGNSIYNTDGEFHTEALSR